MAWLDGGGITSDAGALLPGEPDQALRLTKRFAAGFNDTRNASLLLQRVDRIALGCEDLNHPD